jgi:hypothetical protein
MMSCASFRAITTRFPAAGHPAPWADQLIEHWRSCASCRAFLQAGRQKAQRDAPGLTAALGQEGGRARARHDQGESPAVDLGPCFACGGRTDVRNLICLPFRAPVAGTGWGCFVCGLPADGAVAVLCDACKEGSRRLLHCCRGYPTSRKRTALHGYESPCFDHDPARHAPGD